MEQLALVDPQTVHLERVSSRIGGTVLAFFNARGVGQRFFAGDLCSYVWEELGPCAPDSPGRVMRDLRLHGHLDYEVVNRARALYQVTRVAA